MFLFNIGIVLLNLISDTAEIIVLKRTKLGYLTQFIKITVRYFPRETYLNF